MLAETKQRRLNAAPADGTLQDALHPDMTQFMGAVKTYNVPTIQQDAGRMAVAVLSALHNALKAYPPEFYLVGVMIWTRMLEELTTAGNFANEPAAVFALITELRELGQTACTWKANNHFSQLLTLAAHAPTWAADAVRRVRDRVNAESRFPRPLPTGVRGRGSQAGRGGSSLPAASTASTGTEDAAAKRQRLAPQSTT